MSTQEERIEALERTTIKHGSVLRGISYELIAIKDLVTAQGEVIQDIKEDIDGSFKLLTDYNIHMEQQIGARFDRIEATMATKDDLAAMEKRVREDMATKDDLAAMEKRIREDMATKDDLAAMEKRVREDMATKDDLAAMEDRLLNAFQQLVKMINK